MKIAVFVSGTGRTLQNLIKYRLKNGTFDICIVVADRECPALDIARKNGLAWMAMKDVAQKGCELAFKMEADFICLAGFRLLLQIPDNLEPVWKNRILNVHPSLMPSFCGTGFQGDRIHQKVIEAGVQFTGVTIHFCDNEYDHGPIICQRIIEIDPEWTWEELSQKVFVEECIVYPHALEAIKVFEEEYAIDKMIDAPAVARIARGAYPRQNSAERGKKPLTNPMDLVGCLL